VPDSTQSELALAWVTPQGAVLRTNGLLSRWVGDPSVVTDMLPQLSAEAWQAWTGAHSCQVRTFVLQRIKGQRIAVGAQVDADGDGGWLLSLWRRRDEAEQTAIDTIQRRVLGAVATAQPLAEVMTLLCREVEAVAPELICSVLEIDAEGCVQPLAGPSLPDAYNQALAGLPIGPKAGSCGTAAWRREPVEVVSIATDPLWADYRGLAQVHGLAACWSTPVLLDGQRVAATFALYYRQETAIAPYHRQLVQACTQLCRVALLHHENQASIERLAYFDPITGLANRAQFTRRAESLLLEMSGQGRPAAVLLMDLDRFKAVNELQGHAAGNAVLKLVAQRLAAHLPSAHSLARLGDDEFVVMLPDTDAARAHQVAEGLLAAMEAPLRPSPGHEVKLGISIGLSLYPSHGATLEQLLKRADLALHHAKGAGRQCVRSFAMAMAEALEEKAWMEAELRKALTGGALQLHFQPKLHLDSGALLGAEVLLRWPMPGRGWVPPDQFIPLAEECGLINDVDAWVMEAACAQLAQWQREGLSVPGLAVNVSPVRFQHADVAQHVALLLSQHGLPGAALTLEVTERLMLDEGEDGRAIHQLAALRTMGVGVSIDDFGTGYSSLSYLRRLPVSELKLDRSFVNNLVEDEEDRALTRAVASIAHAMGLGLVAEGVETAAQATLLQQLGCHVAQGFWLSHPLAAEAFASWCRARG
jgi:diguanylate cyclase (GGDEF)-like protein